MKKMILKINVDATEIDKAIEKAKQLKSILKEVEKLTKGVQAETEKIRGITINIYKGSQ